MLPRMLIQTTAWLAMMAGLLFLAAGDWRWPQAWLLVAELAVTIFALNFWLLRHDPALLASRLSNPLRHNQRPWDRLFLLAAGLLFIAVIVLSALDASRFGWSHVPPSAQLAGAVLIALAMFACWLTFRANTFAAPQLRVQPDRQHHVVTEGPYRLVRHPMCAGALLLFVGIPLLLGSWWGLLIAPVIAIAIGIRAVGEERMLRQALPGYDRYAQQVRFRLFPGLW